MGTAAGYACPQLSIRASSSAEPASDSASSCVGSGVFPERYRGDLSPQQPTILLCTAHALSGKTVITRGKRVVSTPSCDSLRMLAASDFALSLRRILCRMFCQPLRWPRSDACGSVEDCRLFQLIEFEQAIEVFLAVGSHGSHGFHGFHFTLASFK